MTLTLTKKLIRIESDKEHPENLDKTLDVIKDYLKEFNHKEFKKDGVKSLLFYNTDKLPKKFKVILNGHLDVVSAKKSQYKPVEKAGKLYGRGSSDMKAAVAKQAEVFKELADKVDYPLGLQIVTDEEVGGFKGTQYQIKKGVRTDFAIAGEMTEFTIGHKAKGLLWHKITAKGKTAHASRPWLGENAIERMNKLISDLIKEFPAPKKESWKTTLNIATIETSNSTYNKIPDDCSIKIDIRYIPEETDTIRERVMKHVPKDFKVETFMYEPAANTDANSKFIKMLQTSHKKIRGKKCILQERQGASDIRHITSVGCEGVEFGPLGHGIHTDDEWVDIKALEDFKEILKDFLMSVNQL